jgi:hypothetical protein
MVSKLSNFIATKIRISITSAQLSVTKTKTIVLLLWCFAAGGVSFPAYSHQIHLTQWEEQCIAKY